MDRRVHLQKEIVEKSAQNKLLCVEDVLKYYSVKGYIPHTYWGSDIYGMKRGRDLKHDEKTIVNVSKLVSVPDFIMKIAYSSKINIDEAKIYSSVTKRIGKRTPHIAKYYTHFLCDNATFRGYRKQGIRQSCENQQLVKTGNAIITLMEYSGSSMYEFLKNNKDSQQEFNFMVQLLYTIHLLQEKNITHGDLMFSNITYLKLDKKYTNTVWKYSIDDSDFYVQVNNHIPLIIDFGEGTMDVTIQEYHKLYKVTDVWILLEQWSYHTYHEDVRKFVKRIMKKMYVNEKPIKKYLFAKHILKDFFTQYTANPEANGRVHKRWS